MYATAVELPALLPGGVHTHTAVVMCVLCTAVSFTAVTAKTTKVYTQTNKSVMTLDYSLETDDSALAQQ